MPMTRNALPLFPLNTVLFPGEAIPLQVFEPRYRQLLDDCQAADGRFGVVLIKTGPEVGGRAEVHEVGTVARIIQVSDVGEGRFFVSAGAERRFRLTTRHPDNPYPIGDVLMLDDEPGPGDLVELAMTVMDSARELFKLMSGLDGGWAGERDLPNDPAALSYFVPKLLRIDPTERQTLLAAGSIAERLSLEAALLSAQAKALKTRVSAKLKGRFSSN
jgi:Lon protease-like protein